MKKLILSACVMLMVATAANAQGFRLGVKAGANLNKISGMSFNDGYNLGYQLGGFAEIDFGDKLGIQPEVLFSQSKTKYEQYCYPQLALLPKHQPLLLIKQPELQFRWLRIRVRQKLSDFFAVA